jgi:3-oxoacyl-[acyl-carrier-protein] synthase II
MPPQLTTRTIDLRRVVITGLGTVNAVGNDVPTTWERLRKGESGIVRISKVRVDDMASQVGGEIKDFDPLAVLDKREVRRLDPVCHYALVASQEAVDDSGLKIDPAGCDRMGVLIGSGIGGLESIEHNNQVLFERGPGRISPFFIPQMVANMPAGVVSMRFGARGPNSCVTTACASGAHAVGEAYRLIQRGDADVMLAGGAEAPIQRIGLAGFASMKAMSTRNDEPARASRPFDADRDGFVIGEGAGTLVLESLEHALARGARIYAELVGYGMSGDAHHMTAPPEDGVGAQLAMRRTLEDGGLAPESIDYINAHGTSTPHNDRIETLAIKKVFGAHASRVAISSTKSMTGHALGAAGGLEAIFSVLAVRDGEIPPTINYETPDPDCDLDYTPNESRSRNVRIALSNSFGFGGTNAALAIARYEEESAAR